MFVIEHDLRLSCRCWVTVNIDHLHGVVTGAQARCPAHGVQTVVSRVPQPYRRWRTPTTRRWDR